MLYFIFKMYIFIICIKPKKCPHQPHSISKTHCMDFIFTVTTGSFNHSTPLQEKTRKNNIQVHQLSMTPPKPQTNARRQFFQKICNTFD